MMYAAAVTVVLKFVQQTEAAEYGRNEERLPERGSHGRSAGGVRELAGGRASEDGTGAAAGQREEDGGGDVRAAHRLKVRGRSSAACPL